MIGRRKGSEGHRRGTFCCTRINHEFSGDFPLLLFNIRLHSDRDEDEDLWGQDVDSGGKGDYSLRSLLYLPIHVFHIILYASSGDDLCSISDRLLII